MSIGLALVGGAGIAANSFFLFALRSSPSLPPPRDLPTGKTGKGNQRQQPQVRAEFLADLADWSDWLARGLAVVKKTQGSSAAVVVQQ